MEYNMSNNEKFDYYVDRFKKVVCPGELAKVKINPKNKEQSKVFVIAQPGAGKSTACNLINSDFTEGSDNYRTYSKTFIEGRKQELKDKIEGKPVDLSYSYSAKTEAEIYRYLMQRKLAYEGNRDSVLEIVIRDANKGISLKCFEAYDKRYNDEISKDQKEAKRIGVIIAVPDIISGTSVYKRAEDDIKDPNKVYLEPTIDGHDKYYKETPPLVDKLYKDKLLDEVLIIDRNGKVYFDSSLEPDKDLNKEINKVRDLYYINNPNWEEQLKKDWEYIFKSQKERNAKPSEIQSGQEAYKRTMKRAEDVKNRLGMAHLYKMAKESGAIPINRHSSFSANNNNYLLNHKDNGFHK